MIYVVLIIVAVFLLLICCLVVVIKTAKARGQKVNELEVSVENARTDLRHFKEFQKQKEEAQNNAEERKESLHTGNDTADFDNSLKLLHGASKNRGN